MRNVAQRPVRSHQQARQIRQTAQQPVIEDDGLVVKDESVAQAIGVAGYDEDDDDGDRGDQLPLRRARRVAKPHAGSGA